MIIVFFFVIREREEKERLAREEKEREEEEYARHKAQLDAMEAKVIFFGFFRENNFTIFVKDVNNCTILISLLGINSTVCSLFFVETPKRKRNGRTYCQRKRRSTSPASR